MDNKAVVIRLKEELNIGNLEKNITRINEIYKMGYEDGLEYISKIKEFIRSDENASKKDKRI